MTATVRGIAVGSRSGSLNLDMESEYSVLYYVTTDDINDGPDTVRTAFGIPDIGTTYSLSGEVNPRAVVTDKRAKERESPFEWEVEVTYSTREKKQPEEFDNPLLQPAEISFGFQSRNKVLSGYYNDPTNPNSTKDLEVGIVASNGELFDPQPEIEVADPILTIKKNLPLVSAQWLMSIANTVNQVEFYGADARQLRLMPPQTDRAYDKVIGFYWPTTFQFVYRYDTWDMQLLNAGTYYMANAFSYPFKDSEGNRFVGLLRANGAPLNFSSTDKYTWGRFTEGGEAVTYTRLRVYREIDFGSLGII